MYEGQRQDGIKHGTDVLIMLAPQAALDAHLGHRRATIRFPVMILPRNH